MSHNRLKSAVRERMASTGEPYTAARRAVIQQQEEQAQDGQYPSETMRSKAFEIVSAQLVKNGQEVRDRLTSASGVNEIQRRFAALHGFRDLGHSVDDRPTEVTDMDRPQWRCRRCGSELQLDGIGGWVSSSGTGRCPHEGALW